MRRNFSHNSKYPGHYRQDMLHWFRERMELSVSAVAVAAGVNKQTTQRVFDGVATQKQVWRIARYFKIDWAMLHDLNLPFTEFHRAALNVGSRSVR